VHEPGGVSEPARRRSRRRGRIALVRRRLRIALGYRSVAAGAGMSKDWAFYSRDADGQPASVRLDMAIAEDAPLAHLPVAAWVQLPLLRPRDDGLPGQADADALDAIEAALAAALVARSTAYVGRFATRGRCDFHFYTSAAGGWKERVASA